MAMNRVIRVDERSQVAEARREAVRLAQAVALDAQSVDRLALVVTEAATNLVKHAREGQILLAPIAADAAIGVEVIALDRGPGMANISASMRDGHSTAGSPGVGLGSIMRLASGLDIYSQPQRGTVLRFEVWQHAPERTSALVVGGVCTAKSGEPVSGDEWSATGDATTRRLLVVDGLGHGPQALAAATAAVRIDAEKRTLAPEALLSAMHGALRSTRGAAASVAQVSSTEAAGIYAGVGNIRAVVHEHDRVRGLVSHNGTLGQQVRKLQAFDFAFPAGAVLVMHSDGIASHWNLDAYPGLMRHHPAVIAAVIHRDHARGHDDATVAVMCHGVPTR
jgi:anti-sigma regulatory factor (Ser/Thr protein kinase)